MKNVWIPLFFVLGFSSLAFTEDLIVPFAIGIWQPYTSDKAPGYGMASEIVAAAFETEGMRIKLSFLPWKRAESSVIEGDYFATFPFLIIPERTNFFYFSKPLFSSSIVVLKYKRNASTSNFQYRNIESLKGFKTGTTAGTAAVTKPLAKAGIECEETSEADQSIQKLVLGRIDLVIDEKMVIIDAIKRFFPDRFKEFEISAQEFNPPSEYLLLVSKKYPDSAAILTRFNKGLDTIKQNGTWNRIIKKYSSAGG